MGASPFASFAEQHGLSYAESGDLGERARVVTGRTDVGELVGGRLPGGVSGLLAHAAGDLTLMVTRVPESRLFLPTLTCRQADFDNLGDRLFGPGGLVPLMERFEFESIELNRRYRIGVMRGGSESRLRQLFAPTFIDWMASSAPEAMCFELWHGTLCVGVEGAVQAADQLERVCGLGAKIAERIRGESLESDPADLARAQPPGLREAELRTEQQLARADFDSPPTVVGEAAKRFVRRRLFRRVGTKERIRSQMLGLEAVLDAYAAASGMSRGSWFAFVMRMQQRGIYPLAVRSLVGTLPGTALPCELGMLWSISVEGQMEIAPAARFEVASEASLRVDPADDRHQVALGGIAVGSPGPGLVLRGDDARVAALVTGLRGGRLDQSYSVVVASVPGGRSPLPEPAIEWLLDPGRCGRARIVFDAGALALVGPPTDIARWSAGALDEFCAGIAPVAEAFGPVARAGHRPLATPTN